MYKEATVFYRRLADLYSYYIYKLAITVKNGEFHAYALQLRGVKLTPMQLLVYLTPLRECQQW